MRRIDQEDDDEDGQDDEVHDDVVGNRQQAEQLAVRLAGERHDAEQLAARHALQAVFAAGDRAPLQEDEVRHLGQRQRRHREVDALAADGDEADDEAEQRRQGDAGEHAELGRPALGADQPAGGVGGGGEVGGMAEREQPGVAEQQVEGAGEDRVAERGHHEHRIEADERRRDQQRQPGDGADMGQARDVGDGAGGRKRQGLGVAHQASLPNRPAGRTISTIAMMTKTTMLDASG